MAVLAYYSDMCVHICVGHTCIYVFVFMHVHIGLCACLCAYARACLYVCSCTCVSVCVHGAHALSSPCFCLHCAHSPNTGVN